MHPISTVVTRVKFGVLGRGVAKLKRGLFFAQYRGEMFTQRERDKRIKKYSEKQNWILFLF